MHAGGVPEHHTLHTKSVTPDQESAASRTKGVFPFIPGNIATVNILEALGPADFPGLLEPLSGSGWKVVHLVAGVESADMPGGFLTQPGQEGGDLIDFLLAVVEPRNQQGRDFHPYPRRFHAHEGIENRLESGTALLSVKIISKGFQVHIGPIEIGRDGRQRLFT